MVNFKIGCHVSAAGGVWNAPKNASELECETFQIFTRPPMGGPAPVIDEESVEKFKIEMEKFNLSLNPSPQKGREAEFVVHAPYIVNFGSAKKPTFHGSISIVSEELKRANMLGARYVMTHLGSFKDLGQQKGMVQAKKGLEEVLKKYEGAEKSPTTEFLLEISAGAGEVIGDTFEELAELMEPLKKYKTFGGICFDTQHAWSSGYDITKPEWTKGFEKTIGLKWLKMSHINDSKVSLGGRKDRHEHIGEGEIGKEGLGVFLRNIKKAFSTRGGSKRETKKDTLGNFCLILETEHDKVKKDIKILKQLSQRDSFGKK